MREKKHNLDAAVFSESDPRSKNSARAVPRKAELLMAGGAVLGYVVDTSVRKRRNTSRTGLPRKRLNEIERIIESRHGPYVDTDDADLYLGQFAAALEYWTRTSRKARGLSVEMQEMPVAGMVSHIRRYLPSLNPAEVENAVRACVSKPQMQSHQRIARDLGVTLEENIRLGLETIGCCDASKAKRMKAKAAAKLRRKADHQREDRRAAGAVPRNQYECNSISEKCRVLGIVRSTFYRNREKWEAEYQAHLASTSADKCDRSEDPYYIEHIGGHTPVAPVVEDGRSGPQARPAAPKRLHTTVEPQPAPQERKTMKSDAELLTEGLRIANLSADEKGIAGKEREAFVAAEAASFVVDVKAAYANGRAQGEANGARIVRDDYKAMFAEPNFNPLAAFASHLYNAVGTPATVIAVLRGIGNDLPESAPKPDPAVAAELLGQGIDPSRVGLLLSAGGSRH